MPVLAVLQAVSPRLRQSTSRIARREISSLNRWRKGENTPAMGLIRVI